MTMPASDPTHLHNALIWLLGIGQGVVLGEEIRKGVVELRFPEDCPYMREGNLVVVRPVTRKTTEESAA